MERDARNPFVRRPGVGRRVTFIAINKAGYVSREVRRVVVVKASRNGDGCIVNRAGKQEGGES